MELALYILLLWKMDAATHYERAQATRQVREAIFESGKIKITEEFLAKNSVGFNHKTELTKIIDGYYFREIPCLQEQRELAEEDLRQEKITRQQFLREILK